MPLAELLHPLPQQHARRNEAQRRPFETRQCGHGQACFSTAGRQHDDPASSRELPGRERCLLIRPELDGSPARSGRRCPTGNEIDKGVTPLLERLHDISVLAGRGTMAVDAQIPDHAGQPPSSVGVDSFDEQRAPIEAEARGVCPFVRLSRG